MRVVIIGGGFAGIAAAKKLYNQLSFEQPIEIILVDKNKYTTMLPSLPDVSGNRVEYKYLIEDIENIIPKGVRFLNKEVNEINFINKTISIEGKELKYDYLVFSPGSSTNFYNHNDEFKKNMKLDSLTDALKIREDFYKFINTHEVTNVVISGAGYTGMELACNLYDFASANNRKANITLIERSDRVLPMLPEKSSRFVTDKLKSLDFNIMTSEEVVGFEDNKVSLKSGKTIDNAFFCWCSGVKIAISPLGKQKTLPDGRIVVDEFLRIPEHPEVFVAGDAAAVKAGSGYIRRSVNFSYMEGKNCGRNIAALLTEGKLKTFKPMDLGWVVPLYVSSIGNAFGVELKGRKGITFHYVMCGLKNYNGRNFRRYLKCAATFVFTKVNKN